MQYEKTIEEEARSFLSDHEDMFVEALVDESDFDRNDINDLDQSWHECITDRAYTVEDANWICSNSDNEETDSGLWEGQDHQTAMSTKAAYTFSSDVWFKCEEIYNEELKEVYDERLEEAEAAYDEAFEAYEDEDNNEVVKEPKEVNSKEIAEQVFAEFYKSEDIEPFEEGSIQESEILQQWLNSNETIGMRGGSPVGSSYIDARCGAMYDTPDYDYVQLDREVALRIPRIAHKYKEEALKIARESNSHFDDWVKRKELFEECRRAFWNSETVEKMKQKVKELVA